MHRVSNSVTFFEADGPASSQCTREVIITGDVALKALEYCDVPMLVAASIFEHNIHNKPVWFSELCRILPIDKHKISHALDTLDDWMIAFHEPGDLGDGKGGYRLYIHDHCYKPIGDVYARVIQR